MLFKPYLLSLLFFLWFDVRGSLPRPLVFLNWNYDNQTAMKHSGIRWWYRCHEITKNRFHITKFQQSNSPCICICIRKHMHTLYLYHHHKNPYQYIAKLHSRGHHICSRVEDRQVRALCVFKGRTCSIITRFQWTRDISIHLKHITLSQFFNSSPQRQGDLVLTFKVTE